MTDLIAVVETTARDPLAGAFALIAVGVLVSRLLRLSTARNKRRVGSARRYGDGSRRFLTVITFLLSRLRLNGASRR
jgi:hypothetical protein